MEGNRWERGLFLYTWDHVVVYVICACGLGTASRERAVIVVTGAEDKSTHPPTSTKSLYSEESVSYEFTWNESPASVFSAGLIKEHLKPGALLSAPSFLDFKF